MSQGPTPEELERRYGQWSTEDLIEAVTRKSDEYIPRAIDVMRRLLDARGVPESEVLSIQTRLGSVQEDERGRLDRVRGWLLVFVLVVALSSLSQLVAAGTLAAAPWSLWPSMMLLLFGVTGIYGVYVTLLLVRKKKRAPVHARHWIVMALLANLASAVFLYIMLGEVPTNALGSALFVAVWLTYLDQSKRVANVYGPSE